MRRSNLALLVLLVIGSIGMVCLLLLGKRTVTHLPRPSAKVEGSRPKLYWFIPDGMRAEPETFTVFKWAEEGKLPNIKKMMDRGTYGFCKPAFPSHTPANFATLFTGAHPEVHGVNDGPMRVEGTPLSQVAVAGFSSTAKKVEPIWVTLERSLDCGITLLAVPGSTPPELKHGITIRGRWGRWGADFHSVNFQDDADDSFKGPGKAAARLFYMGPQLTQRIGKKPAAGWSSIQSYSQPWETEMTAWGNTTYACIYDSTDNQTIDYDTVAFSTDKQRMLCALKRGAWSGWLPITLKWQIPEQKLERDVATSARIKVIKLETNGLFRVRFVYNNVNKYLVEPEHVAAEILEGVGPMVDFVDNFPPQLVFCAEDKAAFLEEADLSLTWHRDAAAFLLKKYDPEVFISDIYTPNQLLTSRWWMGYVDPKSARYKDVSPEQREKLWEEVHWLYRKLDEIVGRLLQHASDNTYVVLSSDHGAVPLDQSVRLNNLFAREGLLTLSTDARTGERTIDWEQTKAIYLNMHNVYVNPRGLGGNWKRGSGADYEQLRQKVKQLLLNLQDPQGVKPVEKVAEVERASQEFKLLGDRSGDLIIANRAGYGWTEETTGDLEIFSAPLITGYKQAIIADNTQGLWTPFIIVGPGIRPGHYLGDTPIDMVDQYPTLLRCLGVDKPAWVQGKCVEAAFDKR